MVASLIKYKLMILLKEVYTFYRVSSKIINIGMTQILNTENERKYWKILF